MPSSRATLLAPRLLLLLLLVAGCTELRLVSDYDEQTDAQITALQRDTGLLLTNLEKDLGTPSGRFDRYEHRYDSLSVNLRALTVRAAARENNEIQVEQLGTLREQISRIAERHRQEQLRSAEIEPIRQIMDQSFGAILRLELAKKRGDA